MPRTSPTPEPREPSAPPPAGPGDRPFPLARVLAVVGASVAAAAAVVVVVVLVAGAPGRRTARTAADAVPPPPGVPATAGPVALSPWEEARTPTAVHFEFPIASGSWHPAAPAGDAKGGSHFRWTAWRPPPDAAADPVPVAAVADGLVVFAGPLRAASGETEGPRDHAVVLAHRAAPTPGSPPGRERRIQSIHTGLDTVEVAPDSRVTRGQRLGTLDPGSDRFQWTLAETDTATGLAVPLDPLATIEAWRATQGAATGDDPVTPPNPAAAETPIRILPSEAAE